MKRVLIFFLVMLLPQLASARMYMCVDEATGATSFTDKACEASSFREEIRVNPVNPGNTGIKKKSRRKAWRSQSDDRKTGSDYSAQRRDLYDNRATASSH